MTERMENLVYRSQEFFSGKRSKPDIESKHFGSA